MGIETLIYGYLAVCASMIAFNCVCIVVFRRRDSALQRRSAQLEQGVAEQIRRIEMGEKVEESHQELLRKKLKRTNHLMAFDETLEHLSQQKPEAVQQYLWEIRTVFACLAVENEYRTPMKMSHFAYVIQKHRIMEGEPVPAILHRMEQLLRENSLYCRENALRAIYSTGDCGCVLHALRIVDANPVFHHAKLLTDGLLSFAGDHGELAAALWQSFDRFTVQMRVVILDYIRFSGADMRRELLSLLADGRQDDELRFSCIRYFGKYPCEEAFPLLLSFAEHPESSRWEYAAVTASALASYPGERTVEALKRNLHSPNWYVRFNAAGSLEDLHLTHSELSDVMDGDDQYAREILQYRLDMRTIRETQEAVTV